MGTVKRKRPATGKAKGRATEETLAELPADALLTDSDAIDQISGLLGSRPWDSEVVEQIAALIRETGRDVAYRETGRETPEDEIETYDDAENEGWLYSDEDRDEEPAQLVASAYARISRIAGADGDPPRCPSCAGEAEWTAGGSRIHCFFCGYEGPAAEVPRAIGTPPSRPAGATAARYDSGFTADYTCDSCGSKVKSTATPPGWTESGKEHRCPACPAGGAGATAPRGMTGEQLAALKAGYLAWSGGFEPAEMTTEEISTFLDTAMDTSFNRDEAIEALRAWIETSN